MGGISGVFELQASLYSEILLSDMLGVMIPSIIAGLLSVRGIDPIDLIETSRSSERLSWERRVGVSGSIVELRVPMEVTVSSATGASDVKLVLCTSS